MVSSVANGKFFLQLISLLLLFLFLFLLLLLLTRCDATCRGFLTSVRPQVQYTNAALSTQRTEVLNEVFTCTMCNLNVRVVFLS